MQYWLLNKKRQARRNVCAHDPYEGSLHRGISMASDSEGRLNLPCSSSGFLQNLFDSAGVRCGMNRQLFEARRGRLPGPGKCTHIEAAAGVPGRGLREYSQRGVWGHQPPSDDLLKRNLICLIDCPFYPPHGLTSQRISGFSPVSGLMTFSVCNLYHMLTAHTIQKISGRVPCI
jgi:hypothetical protein